MRGHHLGREIDDGSQRCRASDAADRGDVRLWNIAPMNDDLFFTEPHPLGEQPVAVNSEGFADQIARVRAILVEQAAAREQLTSARRASLKVAPRVVPAATGDPAVTASIAARSPAGLVAERNHVEATPIPMKRIDGARDGRLHLTIAPAADGHQAASRGLEPCSGNVD